MPLHKSVSRTSRGQKEASSQSGIPLWGHLLLLLGACTAVTVVWSLPVLAVGWPSALPDLLSVRNFAVTGLFSTTDSIGRLLSTTALLHGGVPSAIDGRLSTIIMALAGPWIAWTDVTSWTVLNAAVFSLCLIPLWLAVAKIARPRTAWITVLLFAFLPVYWLQAISLSRYTLSFLFLFSSAAAWVWITPRSRIWGAIVAGLLFGLTIATKDVFLVFVPWIVLAALWRLRRTPFAAIGLTGIFLLCSVAIYFLPYLGDIQRLGYPVNQNLARIWPGAKNLSEESYLHLYPDPYTYYFDRDRFDQQLLADYPHLSFVERAATQKLLLNYHLVPSDPLLSLGNGVWLTVMSIPPFFQQNTTGGLVVWFFLIPGLAILWKKNRSLAYDFIGLTITSYFIVRFVLHYDRDHLMDIGWMLALAGALGIEWVGDKLGTTARNKKLLVIGIVTLLCIQLAQTTRIELARLTVKSDSRETLAIAASVAALPADRVIALDLHPTRMEEVAYLSDRTVVLLRSDTVAQLQRDGKLAAVFARYGITDAFGYDPEIVAAMRSAPNLHIEPLPASASLPSSPAFGFLLNLFH
jgi:hypothetical protein